MEVEGLTLPQSLIPLHFAHLSDSLSSFSPSFSLSFPSHSLPWSLGSRKAPPPGGPRKVGQVPGGHHDRGLHPCCGSCCLSVSPATEELAGYTWWRVSVSNSIHLPAHPRSPSLLPPPNPRALCWLRAFPTPRFYFLLLSHSCSPTYTFSNGTSCLLVKLSCHCPGFLVSCRNHSQ